MITQRGEYEIIDVAAVPSITGDIIPVRDGTARAAVWRMEDVAFLLEAFCERCLAYAGALDAVNLSYVPRGVWPCNVLWACATVRAEDVAGGKADRFVGSSGYCFSVSGRRCIPLQDDAAFTGTIEVADFYGATLLAWVAANRPANLWWESALPVHWQDFTPAVVASSINLVRRMYYLLRLWRRWLVILDEADNTENWRSARYAGEAVAQLTEAENGTVNRDVSGSANYADKTAVNLITFRLSGTGASTSASVNARPTYHLQTSAGVRTDGSTWYTISSYSSAVSSIKFKTKIRFRSLATFALVEVTGRGYARRDGDATSTTADVVDRTRRCPCLLMADLADDPDGYVQEWEINLAASQLSTPELVAFAQYLGFHEPGTAGEAYTGALHIDVRLGSCLDGYPVWRTEINSTGWDWSPSTP